MLVWPDDWPCFDLSVAEGEPVDLVLMLPLAELLDGGP